MKKYKKPIGETVKVEIRESDKHHAKCSGISTHISSPINKK